MVSSRTLPPGLTLAGNNGLLSGTPTVSGSYSLSVVVPETGGATSLPQPFTIPIAPVPVVTTAIQPGVPGIPYTATQAASGDLMLVAVYSYKLLHKDRRA